MYNFLENLKVISGENHGILKTHVQYKKKGAAVVEK